MEPGSGAHSSPCSSPKPADGKAAAAKAGAVVVDGPSAVAAVPLANTRSGGGTETAGNSAVAALTSWLRLWEYAPLKGLASYPSAVSLSSLDLPCAHTCRERHCIVYIFKGLGRGLAVGYGLRATLSLALRIFSPAMVSHPLRTVFRSLVSRANARFALFLGALGFVYRQLQCLLCKMFGRPSKRASAIAAFVAGSTVLIESPTQRSTLAGFLFVRAVFETVRTLVHFDYLTGRTLALPVVFGLANSTIMLSFLRQPSAMDRGYHRWILRMSALTAEQVHAICGMSNPLHIPCQPVYHHGSCVAYNLRDWVHAVLARSTLVYLPVHLVPALLFKTRRVLAQPLQFVREALMATLRSSLFLGSYVAIVKSNVCFFRWLLQSTSSNAVRWAGFSTGAALLLEHPRRHAELVQYVVPRGIETFFNLHNDELPRWLQWLRRTGVGDVLLVCSALAMFVVAADTPPKLKGLNATVFRLIFGKSTTMLGDRHPGAGLLGPSLNESGGSGGEDEHPHSR